MKSEIINITEEVEIGDKILEVGDNIKIVEATEYKRNPSTGSGAIDGYVNKIKQLIGDMRGDFSTLSSDDDIIKAIDMIQEAHDLIQNI